MAFPTSQGISFSNIGSFNVFTTLNWSDKQWANGSTNLTPILLPHAYDVLPFPTGAQGTAITTANAKKQASYPLFPFETVWAIIEDETYPFLLQTDGENIDDPALTSRKVYVFIAEDVTGSLFHEGKVYKSLKKSVAHDSIIGTAGQTVTHVYGGNKMNDSDALPYVFAFSGVQDPERPGGYGDIQKLTERTVTLLADRSNNAAFYYIVSEAPPYDYLLSLQGNGMMFHIAVLLEVVSEIKVVMPDGLIGHVSLVPIDDPTASLIRVLTLNGIVALQNVEIEPVTP